MNIDYKLIKEKYPEIFEQFVEIVGINIRIISSNSKEIEGYKSYDEIVFAFLKDICYCDIEKFFDNLDIDIYIYPSSKGLCFDYVDNLEVYESRKDNIYCENRESAKEKAILKAFEMLNNRIKKYKVENDKN